VNPDRILELALAKAVRLIRAGQPNAARLSLEVAVYAVERIEGDPS
jgi:hypothetical protein